MILNSRPRVLEFFTRLTPRQVVALTSGVFAMWLLLYSQTMSFVWDEGFHLLSAQLIDNGKTPYLDYCFPQTPLNAYWNAAWMHFFHQDWRITHVLAALEAAGSIYLMADWVLVRVPLSNWQLPCAIVTAILMGCNPTVAQFGTIAQAYAIGMFLSAAAFRLTVSATERSSLLFAFWAGMFASGAAGCTLLTAPIVPVLLIWLWFYSLAGERWQKAIAFLVGCVPPFIPVIILFAKGPKQTIFNVVRYQALLRRVNWPGATTHDLDVFTAWLQSTPALLLLLFSVSGFLFLRKADTWKQKTRAEFSLCVYLSLALILYISTAHPTFQRYMVVAVPFCAAIAAVGFYSIGSRFTNSGLPGRPLFIVCSLMILALGKELFDDRDSTRWSTYEKIAQKIREVTPPSAALYADEQVYFLLRRQPPFAMEFSYSHKLNLPKEEELLYHVVSEAELTEQVKQGKYATVESCKDDRIDELKLPDLYPQEVDIGDCSIYWGKMKTATTKK